MQEKLPTYNETETVLPQELSTYPHFIDDNGDIIVLLEPRLKV